MLCLHGTYWMYHYHLSDPPSSPMFKYTHSWAKVFILPLLPFSLCFLSALLLSPPPSDRLPGGDEEDGGLRALQVERTLRLTY